MSQKEGVIIFEHVKAQGNPYGQDKLNVILCNSSVATIMGFDDHIFDANLDQKMLLA